MKRFFALALALAMMLCLVACGSKDDINKKSEGTMTWAEYDAAALDSNVVIEAYVQAKQGWWDNSVTI